MATKYLCDGCGVDITTKKHRGDDGVERTAKIGEPGDGLGRRIVVQLGVTRRAIDLCPGCLTRAIESLSDALPGSTYDLLSIQCRSTPPTESP